MDVTEETAEELVRQLMQTDEEDEAVLSYSGFLNFMVYERHYALM